MSASAALKSGTIVANKYRIDGVLGAGGMGVVMSATHVALDAPVAIKLLREDMAQDEDLAERLMFEARAVARMRSKHVVRVLDVARLESGEPYIVLERLQGADLAQILTDRGPLPVAETVDYLLQACEGLAEAHGIGIVHRDLKPENLFLSETPEGPVLKLLDFGISKNVGNTLRGQRHSTDSGDAIGSPYYMSPEQMRASPLLDARADIWSLGAIAFELLTGKCPFEAATPAAVCTKVLVHETPSLREQCPEAPPALEAVVRRCLEKSASARFQNVGELGDALREATGLDPRSASGVRSKSLPAPALADFETTLRPKRRWGSALLVLAVTAGVAGVGFWNLRERAGEQVASAAAATLPAPVAPAATALPAPVEPVRVEPVPSALPTPARAAALPKPKPAWTAPVAAAPWPVPSPAPVSEEPVREETAAAPAEAAPEPTAHETTPVTDPADGRYGL